MNRLPGRFLWGAGADAGGGAQDPSSALRGDGDRGEGAEDFAACATA